MKAKLTIKLHRAKGSVWIAECPAIPGFSAEGKTKAEALKNVKEAAELILKERNKWGLPPYDLF